ELHALENVRSVLDQETTSEKESLIISIRWRARALRGHESEIDRFLRFWIALEVLVEGEGQKLVDKVTLKLKGLYPRIDEQKIKRIVGPIYGMRGNIVHQGIHCPQDLTQELIQLECIYDDLLKEKLGIEPNHSSNEHFVKFNEL
ncbi:MAG: HEPN domain-containing protein, partial [Methanothrix sp.]|nr:HEPN domain-containing protein [Methanothrix sp.]